MNQPLIVQIPVPGLSHSVRIAHLTDSHIGKFDESDLQAETLRQRMENLHAGWGADFENSLGTLLQQATDAHADAVFLTGDAIDFPAPASVDFAKAFFKNFFPPIFYIPGNHDWSFSYQRGCNALRETQRPLLAPLFLDALPVGYASRDLGGLQIICLDNSLYQIDAAQLAFVRSCLAEGKPSVLLLHIPITLPILRQRTTEVWGKPILMGEEMDEETRRQWTVETPVPETAELIDLLRNAPNLHALFCGHVHFEQEEQFSPSAKQYVGAPAFAGGIRLFEFQPA